MTLLLSGLARLGAYMARIIQFIAVVGVAAVGVVVVVWDGEGAGRWLVPALAPLAFLVVAIALFVLTARSMS
jgi:peptidoglycan/LPS O-acetylase OafA/YrhL